MKQVGRLIYMRSDVDEVIVITRYNLDSKSVLCYDCHHMINYGCNYLPKSIKLLLYKDVNYSGKYLCSVLKMLYFRFFNSIESSIGINESIDGVYYLSLYSAKYMEKYENCRTYSKVEDK